MLPMPDGWSKGLPAEQAKYWWNEDGAPILVSVLYSGTSGTCFAAKGLHCWNRAQWVKDMGGYWKKAAIPAVPTTKEKNDGQR